MKMVNACDLIFKYYIHMQDSIKKMNLKSGLC